MTKTITYADQTITVDSLAAAKSAVQHRAARYRAHADAGDSVVYVRAGGDIYAYLDQDAADADDTGALAFAVIS